MENDNPDPKPKRATLAEARAENLTLTELKAENRQLDDEGPELYVPGSGQAPPVKPQHHQGVPIPEGTTIQQLAKRQPDMVLATPPGPIYSIAEREIFEGHWAKIDTQAAEEAALAEAKTAKEAALIAEAAEWWLPYPLPSIESLPPDVLPFSKAKTIFGYTSEFWFVKFTLRFGYPLDFAARRIISRRGCDELLRRRRKKEADSKNAKRADQVPEPTETDHKEKSTVRKRNSQKKPRGQTS